MPLTNFHTHTTFSDGSADLPLMLATAKKLKLSHLGFSDHAPVPFSTSWSMKEHRLSEYFQLIESFRNKSSEDLTLFTGLEVDFISGIQGPHTYAPSLDYTIGAVHFLIPPGEEKPLALDDSKEGFRELTKLYYQDNLDSVAKHFFETLREMILTDPPDIVAHFDYVKRYMTQDEYRWCEEQAWFSPIVEEILDGVVSRNCIVECNTAGWHNTISEQYPSSKVLKMCKEKNVRMMINSDAHHPDHILRDFDKARDLLKESGILNVWHLSEERDWVATSL